MRATTTIGFIGLGAMGSRIAGRLLASGHQVYGTNRTAAKAAPLPSARLADRMLDTAARLGYAHRDVAALFDVLARLDEVSEEAP